MEERQLNDFPELLDVKVPLKSRIFSLILLLGAGAFFLYLVYMIPKYGLWLGKDVIGSDLDFLKIRLSKEHLSYPLYALSGLCLLAFLYIVAYIKSLSYRANQLNFIHKHGVLNTVEDSMNMVHIKDHRQQTSLIEKMLGLSTIKIISADKTNPVLFIRSVAKEDANQLMIFFNNYALANYVDFRVKTDLHKQNPRGPKQEGGFLYDDDGEPKK